MMYVDEDGIEKLVFVGVVTILRRCSTVVGVVNICCVTKDRGGVDYVAGK